MIHITDSTTELCLYGKREAAITANVHIQYRSALMHAKASLQVDVQHIRSVISLRAYLISEWKKKACLSRGMHNRSRKRTRKRIYSRAMMSAFVG